MRKTHYSVEHNRVWPMLCIAAAAALTRQIKVYGMRAFDAVAMEASLCVTQSMSKLHLAPLPLCIQRMEDREMKVQRIVRPEISTIPFPIPFSFEGNFTQQTIVSAHLIVVQCLKCNRLNHSMPIKTHCCSLFFSSTPDSK